MKKKIINIIIASVFLVGLASCTKNKEPETPSTEPGAEVGDTGTEEDGEVVVLNYPTFHIGVNSSAEYFAEALKIFNEEYAGKIRVDIEEIPGDQAYTDKMKILLSTNDLPDIVNTGGYNLLDLALERDLVLDLTPYLDEDSDWKNSLTQSSLDSNTRDGKVYAVSDETALMGYFYNKEHFEAAGISEPPKTWDEFFVACDKLLEIGITPISMDTFDSGWLTSLWFTAILGSSNDEGFKMVSEYYPETYETPEFIEASKKVQEMFLKYTTDDAIGGKYENGANNFISGETAMVANGGWMINDFEEADILDKIGVAIYPENGVFDTPNPGLFVAAKDKKTQDAAVEFIKFLTSERMQIMALEMVGRVPTLDGFEIPSGVKESNPTLAELFELSKTADKRYNNYQTLWYPNVVDGLSTYYPELATGDITPEEFAENLTSLAKKN